MRFPFTSIFLLGMLFLSMSLLRCSTKTKAPASGLVKQQKNYTLKVERGAFHYDSFILEGTSLRYMPEPNSNHPNTLYNTPTNSTLDSAVAQNFIDKIVRDGFWKLNPAYKSGTTCTSQLRITLKSHEKSKTVICDDFDRDCPQLLKYIDQKIVELEGNGLKRVYLPG